MRPHLYSYPICPFVQRVALALAEKGAAHDVTYIDLADKPDWFLAKSPTGNVPALEVADGVVLIESQAIVEYVDDVHAEPRLRPEDPVHAARDRAWFSFAADELIRPSHRLLLASEEAAFESARKTIDKALRRIESELEGTDSRATREWLSGDGSRFGLADVAVGPVFTRLAFLERLGAWSLPDDLPNVAAWRTRFLARPSLDASVPPQFEEVMLAKMKAKNALALRPRVEG